ncbi:hypothetical protein MMC16_000879 [Acarospora aff. strigata]|nr:hypothetical protein [Acarospora aff. strigata]
MGEVYSMSYLTISATASSNSTEGLFRKRPSSTTKPCSATVGEGHNLFAPGEYCCYDDGEWSRYVNEAPLSKRAWVYQERLLSPRIVHFAEDQIFWECRQVRASEGFPSSIPPRYDIGTRRLVPSLEEREEQTRFLEVWDSIVKAYTSGILTYNSDKLTAVLALAKELSHSSSRAGTYLAGLWKGPIVDQLLWSASNSTVRSPVYRAPTWSWASMDGPISPRFNWSDIGPDGEKQTSRKMVEVLDATVVPKQGPFDTVSSGVLRLSGPLLKFNLLPNNKPTKTVSDDLPEESMEFTISAERGHIGVDDSSNENPPFGPRGFYMPLYEHSEAKGRLDDDRSLDDPQDFFFMPLLSFNDYYRGSDEEAAEISSIQGLILEPAKTQTGQYKRCGICSVSEYDAAKLFCALGNQDPEQLQFEALASRKLTLDEFLPPNWSGKSLDFIPKEFDCYVISII